MEFEEVQVPVYSPSPIAEGKLRSSSKPHYFRVLLWGTQEHYDSFLKVDADTTTAMCVTDTWLHADGSATVNPKLGEIHFVSGTWNVNTVAHEIQHAIIHRMRYLDPAPRLVLNELDPEWDTENEEVIAYEAGNWVEAMLRWLTKVDPQSTYPNSLFER